MKSDQMTDQIPTVDITIEHHGTNVSIAPVSYDGRKWIQELVAGEGWHWFGASLCIDPRYAGAILQIAKQCGLKIKV